LQYGLGSVERWQQFSVEGFNLLVTFGFGDPVGLGVGAGCNDLSNMLITIKHATAVVSSNSIWESARNRGKISRSAMMLTIEVWASATW
jgi:hypothetical protein